MAKIVTGHKGIDHITSDDVSSFQRGVVGDYDYLLSDNPETFVATIGSNNTITLCDAEIVIQGTHARIFSTDSVQLEQGTTGVTRIDSIVARYTRDGNGVEDVTVIAKTGTSEPPELEQTDIRGAGTVREVALWNVTLNGNVINEPVRVIPVIDSLRSLQQRLQANVLLTNNLQNLYNVLSNSVGDINTAISGINTHLAQLDEKKYIWSPFTIKNKSSQNDEQFSTDIGNYVSTYKSSGGAIDKTATTITQKDASGNIKCQHIFYSDGSLGISFGGNNWFSQPFIQRGYVTGTPKTAITVNTGSVTIDKKTYNVTKKYYTVEVKVTFAKPYASTPTIILTPYTSVPEICFAGVTNPSKTGFTIHITRANTGSSGVYWTALGNL